MWIMLLGLALGICTAHQTAEYNRQTLQHSAAYHGIQRNHQWLKICCNLSSLRYTIKPNTVPARLQNVAT